MEYSLLMQGVVLGFSIAAPVGPVGVLCIRRTLAYGQMYGLFSGLGAATADAVYGAVAGFGLTAVSLFLLEQQFWLAGVGGLYLLYLGLKTLRAAPALTQNQGEGKNLADAFLSTFALTLTNPVTILSFAAIFAGLGLAAQSANSFWTAATLVFGVFAGSALWWFSLSAGVSLFRAKLSSRHLRWINRASGLVICGFGLVILTGLF